MNKVISLTDNAVKQIKKIIAQADKTVEGVIVGVDKSGCSGYAYKLDFAKNTNPSEYEVIEKDGVKVFIDPKAIIYLLGTEMDYKKEKFSSQFIFKNPNETERCGCGESFKV